MRDPRRRSVYRRAGPFAAIAALAVGGAAGEGCGGGGGTGTGAGGSTTSSGTMTTSSGMTTSSSMTTSSGTGGGSNCVPTTFGGQLSQGANGGFTDAFDASPSAMGTTVFFTGVDMAGNPGVFKTNVCPAGAATPVYTGGAFEAPFGIAVSSDDMTLYVADLSAAEDPTDTTGAKDKGVLFTLSAAGGAAPTNLVGSVSPRGLTVVSEGGSDQIYFSGIDKANGMAGVFKIAAAGGSVTVIAEGAPFNDPGGVTVAANGDVYVLDTSASGSHLGDIIVVPKGGAAAEFVPNIQVGYPAGIALMKDDSALLASGLDPTAETDTLVQVTVSSKAVANNSMGIGTFGEAAGLHRAQKVDVFAWADTKATPSGMSGTGTVFVIK